MKKIINAKYGNNSTKLNSVFLKRGGIRFRHSFKLFFMCALFFNSLLNPNFLSAQRIQFEPDLPTVTSEEEALTIPAPPTLCARVGGQWSVDGAIGTSGALIPTRITTASEYLTIYNNQMPNGLRIFIKGTFTINVPFSFTNCDVRMDNGAQIKVINQMTSITSRFFACNDMWEGIKVENAGTLILQDVTEIEDAQKAVDVTEKCTNLRIIRTIFNRNRTGIFVHSSTSSVRTLSFKSFYKNTFSCTSVLNNNRWGDSGITTESINIPNLGIIPGISNPKGNTAKNYANLFTGRITVGIEAQNSMLNIQICRFVEIDEFRSLRAAVGINATKSDITLTGLGIRANPNEVYTLGVFNPSDMTFFNCKHGAIMCNASNLVLRDAFISFARGLSENTSTVVQCLDNQNNEKISMTNNHFNIHLKDGVGILISRSQVRLDISNNYFTTSNIGNVTGTIAFIPKEIGLHILSGNSTDKSEVAVLNNQFLMPRERSFKIECIRLDGGFGYNISNNIIDVLPGSKDCIGINCINIKSKWSAKSNITSNQIFSEGLSTTDNPIGIRFFNSTVSNGELIKVCDNRIEKAKTGMLFIGSNNLILANNHFFENKKSLLLEKNASFSPAFGGQWKNDKFRKNYFEDPLTTTSHTLNTAEIEAGGNPFLSQFGIDTRAVLPLTAGRNYSKVAYENIVVPSGFSKMDWFNSNDVKIDQGCNDFVETATWEALDEEIFNGRYGNESPTLRWETERYLYDKLLNNSELVIGFPERETFLNLMHNTNIPIFNQLKKDIDNFSALTLEQENQMNILQANLATQKEYLYAFVEENNEQFGEGEWSESVKSIFQGLSSNLSNTQSSITALNQVVSINIHNRIEALSVANNAIQVVAPHEQFAKEANDYWLKMLLTENHLNEQQKNAVEELAAKCFSEIGPAKYQAINILPLQEEGYYNNSACTLDAKIMANPSKSVIDINIMPNPANEIINIIINSSIDNPCTEVLLFDISGKVVKQRNNDINNSNFLIETEELTNGIYFLQVKCKDKSTKTQKVSILH